MKTVKQLHLNKAFPSKRSSQEEQKQDEKAPNLKLQVVSSIALDGSPRFSTILSPASVLAADNNKRSRYETRDGAGHLCKAFLKLADALPAINAKAFLGILVQENRNLESVFTRYSSTNDLRIFSGEQTQKQLFDKGFEKIDVQNSAGVPLAYF